VSKVKAGAAVGLAAIVAALWQWGAQWFN